MSKAVQPFHPTRVLGGIRLGSIAGTEIEADWSLLLIFGIILTNLGLSVFPMWHPDWSPALSWSVALAASLLFFSSIVAHEMSHALVARRHQVPIVRITLFALGGMAQMDREPQSPKAEFQTAVVGPLSSLIIGVIATLLASWMAEDSLAASGGDITHTLMHIGPVPTLLFWLGPVNVLLAIFNMVPAFPLDGGRVFRALLWWVTDDLKKATQWAASVGQGFSWILIGTGIAMAMGIFIPFLGVGLLPGLWLVLIGWFLLSAARSSSQLVIVREALNNVSVADVMQPQSRFLYTTPDTSLESFVRGRVMISDQLYFPVLQAGRFVGLIGVADLRRTARDRWSELNVGDIMIPAEYLTTLEPEQSAADSLDALSYFNQVPIVRGQNLLGILHRHDLMRWLALRPV